MRAYAPGQCAPTTSNCLKCHTPVHHVGLLIVAEDISATADVECDSDLNLHLDAPRPIRSAVPFPPLLYTDKLSRVLPKAIFAPGPQSSTLRTRFASHRPAAFSHIDTLSNRSVI